MHEPPGGVIYQNDHWAVYLRSRPLLVAGQGFITLRRHCEDLRELTPEEAMSLGPMLQQTMRAFHVVMAPERIHLGLYGEETAHLHWHLTPRTRKLPAGNIPLTVLHILRVGLVRLRLYRPANDEVVANLAAQLRHEFYSRQDSEEI